MDVYEGRSVELWTQMLKDPNRKRREEAVHALGQIGAPAVMPLVRMFVQGKTEDRHWAVTALAEVGLPARPALPAIQKALKDPHPQIRRAARLAVRRIDPDSTRGAWSHLGRWLRRFFVPSREGSERRA